MEILLLKSVESYQNTYKILKRPWRNLILVISQSCAVLHADVEQGNALALKAEVDYKYCSILLGMLMDKERIRESRGEV